ncbi:CRP/FNR family transcriptional regulator, anaerobic regulatory protein [Raineyella antarctica]|uniref:CRP/FNR family transcriptional regulator, anaerobic regulatory protein n=1 Tax=Raineyella antarctica TaxID=1577474 RepID=A0A1G6H3E4_9ACTN|nr:Crp/Fnr family transcriptional regulator [Raineyella antarctica]SDB88673.1 CRP/FNR family transcriptional regulator, anaerobic regulatory protein [Raineyella antarctica]
MRTTLPLAPRGDTCVSRVPIFGALSAQDQDAVAGLARSTTVAKGEVIYRAGQETSQLMVVHTGKVRISRYSPDGHEQLIRVLGPGDFIGEGAFLTGERPDHWATAMTDSRMCVFRHDDLAGLVAGHPSIGLGILTTISRRLSETEHRLAALSSADVDVRLADYLLDLPSERIEGCVRLRLPLAKKDIASLLGTTPETLSRTLARWAHDGVVALHGTREIDLLEPGTLVDLVGGR